MDNETRSVTASVLAGVKDRRSLHDDAPITFRDFLPTYGTACCCAAFYYLISKDSTELARAAWMFWGTTIVALSAARCAKKETDRKIAAIVRRLEDKGLL